MGLDIIIEGGQGGSFRAGSYSGFHAWRTWLARVIGINIDKLAGYGGPIDPSTLPFFEMFNHSDCDGDLKKRQCKNLSDDFALYLFVAMESFNEFYTDDDDSSYFMSKYHEWNRACSLVAEGKAKRLVFC
jgi:hypothetical protein